MHPIELFLRTDLKSGEFILQYSVNKFSMRVELFELNLEKDFGALCFTAYASSNFFALFAFSSVDLLEADLSSA